MRTILLALFPVILIILFIYRKDKYEKEPPKLMAKAFVGGIFAALTTLGLAPVLVVFSYIPKDPIAAFIDAFYSAALPEESLKFLFLFLFIWRQKDFNERFDGILYAVLVAMGFAALENILYVMDGNIQTAIGRAILSVPGHGFFGVIMGYYFALARFSTGSPRIWYLLRSWGYPILAHGTYNFLISLKILFTQNEYIATILSIIFIRFIFWLWQQGFRKIEQHSDASVFKSSVGNS